jgi:hypothetical protein
VPSPHFAPAAPTATPVPGAPGGLTPQEQAILAQSRFASEANMSYVAGVRVGRRLRFGEALQVGLNLARSCLTVVQRAPELLAVTAVALVFGLVLVVGYVKLLGGFDAIASGGRFAVMVKDFPLLLVLAVVGVCSQAVIVVVAREVVDGRRGSVAQGWTATVARLPQLIGFALVFTIERSFTNALRNSRGGRFAADLIDRAWDFATFLAVPVIVFEPGVGPLAAVQRSAQLVRTRMGTQLAATGVIGIAVFVCTLPFLFVALAVGMMVSPMVAVILVLMVLLLEVLVASTLQGVLSAVMYRFVTTGLVAPAFSETQLMRVFGTSPSTAGGWAPAPA